MAITILTIHHCDCHLFHTLTASISCSSVWDILTQKGGEEVGLTRYCRGNNNLAVCGKLHCVVQQVENHLAYFLRVAVDVQKVIRAIFYGLLVRLLLLLLLLFLRLFRICCFCFCLCLCNVTPLPPLFPRSSNGKNSIDTLFAFSLYAYFFSTSSITWETRLWKSTFFWMSRLKLPLSILLTCRMLSARFCNRDAFLVIMSSSRLNSLTLSPSFSSSISTPFRMGMIGVRNSCAATFMNSLLILSFWSSCWNRTLWSYRTSKMDEYDKTVGSLLE